VNLNNGEASTLTFSKDDTDKNLRSWLTNGCIIKLYADTNSSPSTLQFTGQIEKKPLTQLSKNQVTLSAQATELFYIDILNIRVAETYTDTTVNAIVTDLLDTYLPAGYGSHNIAGPDVTVPLIHFNYRTLKDCLDQLASLAAAQYRCSPALSVTWEPLGYTNSGVTLTAADISGSPTLSPSISEVANVVYGAFGIGEKLDSEGTVFSYWQAVYNQYAYATRIIPTVQRFGVLAFI
jgi:hypothetical protein